MLIHIPAIEYCHCGHKWIFVKASLLYSDYYYCSQCDSFFVPSIKKITSEAIDKDYCEGRAKEMKKYALLLKARKKVTYEDLVGLGYLEGED